MANTALDGKPYAGNPHVRIDEGDGAPAKPRRSSLLYNKPLFAVAAALVGASVFAHVYDDAKLIHFGLQNPPANPTHNVWNNNVAIDYRHANTLGSNGNTHKLLYSNPGLANVTTGTTDVYTPTLGRTLHNEPYFRLNQLRDTTQDPAKQWATGEVQFRGAESSMNEREYTIIARIRPDILGNDYSAGNHEWWRMIIYSPNWGGTNGIYIAASYPNPVTNYMYVGWNINGFSDFYSNRLKMYDGVWNEIACVVKGNTVRMGICNEKIHLGGTDPRIAEGNWIWQSGTKNFKDRMLCPANNTYTLCVGRSSAMGTNVSSFRGDVHMIGFWGRALSDHEIYEAFAGGHTPLVAVGGEASGFAAEAAFAGSTETDVTLPDNRPASWRQIPPKLVQGKKFTIPFEAAGWHMELLPTGRNMPQIIRIPCDAATTAVGAQLKVMVDSTVIGTATMRAGKTNCQLMIPGGLFTAGSHNLVLERTDSGAGDLVIDGVFADGSWRVGDNNRYTGGSATSATGVHQMFYGTSDDYQGKPKVGYIPYDYDVLDGNWNDCSEFCRNNWNNAKNAQPGNQQGSTRLTFEIPQEVYDAGYRYAIRFQLFGAANKGKDKNDDYRCKWVINGTTNIYGAASMTAQEFKFDITDRIVPGANSFQLVDDEIGKTIDNNGDWTWDNWFTQLKYATIDIQPPKRGCWVIIR